MKKQFNVIMVVLFILLLSACNVSENDIPFFVYDFNDNYMNQFKEDILATDFKEFNIVVYDSANSQLIQNEQINKELNTSPQLMIINPVDRLSAYSIIEKTAETNTSLIFINREPLNEDMKLRDNVYYIGAPAENSAIIQAQIIAELFGDPNHLNQSDKNGDNQIDIILLKGEQGHQDAEIRTQYVLKELTDMNYKLNLLSISVCDWSQEIAQKNMENLIQNYGDQIEIVISNNDAMAIGAIDALVEDQLIDDVNGDGLIDKEIEPWIPVIGIDGISEAIVLKNKGYLYSTVYNDTYQMADAINELALAILSNEDVNNISYDLVDGRYIWIDYSELK